jgi:hypothetical protein
MTEKEKHLDCYIEGLQDKDTADFMLALANLIEQFGATITGILRLDDNNNEE